MVVYRYSLRKFLRTPSTWIILFIGIMVMFWIGGFLNFYIMSRHWNLKSTDMLKEFAMKGAFIISYATVGNDDLFVNSSICRF